MLLHRQLASLPLRPLVQSFEERVARFDRAAHNHPLPARPDQFIEIYLAELYRVAQDINPAAPSPEMPLAGSQSHGRTSLLMASEIRAFSLRFHPGALHRLGRIDMRGLADQGLPMVEVFGWRTDALRDGLFMASNFSARVTAAERWPYGLIDQARPAHRVNLAGRLLMRSGGQIRIERWSAGLVRASANPPAALPSGSGSAPSSVLAPSASMPRWWRTGPIPRRYGPGSMPAST